MSALREDWQVLQALFPADWAELGRSTGAVARLRGFKPLNDLFRTLLLHVGCGWSLRETAVQAKLAGIACWWRRTKGPFWRDQLDHTAIARWR